ncbi:MAG: hypothetical protein QXN15_02600 [Candidatus Jordarchaeales archaeon]|nr:hypothetical protein [Candidatus Jordarchaeia archaeon]
MSDEAVFEGGGRKHNSIVLNSLRRFKSKLVKALHDSATMMGLCFLDIKGRIVYVDPLFSRFVLRSISNYVKKHFPSLPVGSYVIPDDNIPVILWRVSDQMFLAAQTRESVAPLITRTSLVLRLAKKFIKKMSYPSDIEESLAADDFNIHAWEVFSFKEDFSDFALGALGEDKDVLKVVEAIDGRRSVLAISKHTGVPLDKCVLILRNLLEQGALVKVEICPLIRKVNAGKLLLFGIQEKYVRLYRELKTLCDGTRSVKEIADALGIDYDNLRYLLSILGEDVIWVKREG